MKARSLVHASEDAAYRELRDRLVPGRCQVCPRWLTVGVDTGCRGEGHELHHLRKRSSSGALAHPGNVLVSCAEGNRLVEDEPELAHAAGLVVRPGDRWWDELSSRRWRKHYAETADVLDSKIVPRREASL